MSLATLVLGTLAFCVTMLILGGTVDWLMALRRPAPRPSATRRDPSRRGPGPSPHARRAA